MGRAAIALAGGLAWLLLGVFHQGAERYVAIDNVCAWPNLTLMPDGSVVAAIFNRPYHGLGVGDVDCWASRDGRLWEKRGSPAVHQGKSNRMNVAAGLAHDGSLVVLASGWGGRDFQWRIPLDRPVGRRDPADRLLQQPGPPAPALPHGGRALGVGEGVAPAGYSDRLRDRASLMTGP